jgi:hypothetical protein
MADDQGANAISLREPQRSNSSEQEPNTSLNDEQAGRQRESDRKRAIALLGSALSQLPIWGTLNLVVHLDIFSRP